MLLLSYTTREPQVLKALATIVCTVMQISKVQDPPQTILSFKFLIDFTFIRLPTDVMYVKNGVLHRNRQKVQI